MKRVIMINGSPRRIKSTSFALLKYISGFIASSDKEILSLSSSIKTSHIKPIEKISEATDIIIAFPVYVDCIPALLQDFMEKYNEAYRAGKSTIKRNLYVIINCGFPEEEHTRMAMEVMRYFADVSGFNWQFGVGIGMGGMVNPKDIPPTVGIVRPVYDELLKIPAGINNGNMKDLKKRVSFISPQVNILGKK